MKILYLEALNLIKNNNEYFSIFKLICLKYQSNGALKGIIHIEKPSSFLYSFLINIIKKEDKNKISINIQDFFEIFKAEKFKELNNVTLMSMLFKDSFYYKKDISNKEKLAKELFFSTLPLQKFINSGNKKIENLYKENPKKLEEILKNLEIAETLITANSKNENRELTPLQSLSAKVSSNPHYFDLDTISGKIFLDYLCFLENKKDINSNEEIAELLLKYFIVRDEFSNFTTLFNLLGDNSWLNFYKNNQPINLSLYNLKTIKKIFGIKNIIFVFENPTVFRILMEKFIKDNIDVTLICTSGQLNLSSLIILDIAVASGNIIYYSGDFDPEGLQIAQKLKLRIGKNLNFLNMNIEDYNFSLSDISIDNRLSKLKNIHLDNFKEVVTAMEKEKKAGYQELLIERYYISIKKILM